MGRRVEAELEEVDVEADDHATSGRTIPGIQATCNECGHEACVFGTSDKSKRAALASLRETCPENQENFYVDADE